VSRCLLHGRTYAKHLNDANATAARRQRLINVPVVVLVEDGIEHARAIRAGSAEQKLCVLAAVGGGEWNGAVASPGRNHKLAIGRGKSDSLVSDVEIKAPFDYLDVFGLEVVEVLRRLLGAELLHVRVVVVEGYFEVKDTICVGREVADADGSVEAVIGATRQY
jgi:hypothetical protein